MLCGPTVVYGKIRDDTLYFVNSVGFPFVSEELSSLVAKHTVCHSEMVETIPGKISTYYMFENGGKRNTYNVAGKDIVVDLSLVRRR